MADSPIPDISLRFRLCGDAYQEVLAWQRAVDRDILTYQVHLRGQALVSRLGQQLGVQKITQPPELGEAEPYYGTFEGAYRYTFHPVDDGCELEVHNGMGGFAFFYPEPIQPLRLKLANQPELRRSSQSWHTASLDPANVWSVIDEHDPARGEIRFYLPPELYSTFSRWTWYGRSLNAYDFIFKPARAGCQVKVRSRESGIVLDLTKEVQV